MRILKRLPADGRLAGVCAGIAHYLNVDASLVRLAWLIFSIAPGVIVGGVVAYIAAWILMPVSTERLETGAAGRRLTRSGTDRKVGGVCGGIAEYFGVDVTAVRVAVVILSIYPGAVIFGVIAYAIAWLIIPERLVPFAPTPVSAQS